jgi:hypothetical protein
MSHPLVSHSPDLTQLTEEEYDIEIRDANLLVHHVPYVTAAGIVDYGILVSELTSNGESTVQPGSHVIRLVGGIPYDHQGQVVSIVNDQTPHPFGEDLIAACSMSGKKNGQAPNNYYDKITHYVNILSSYARAIDSSATHKNSPARESSAEESVFRYHDGASSRAGISAVTSKLKLDKIAIVGLGGTGAYILDLVAKTPVEEIHLFDDDIFDAHNAFRSPGAASLDEVKAGDTKVDYLFKKYDPIRRNIFAHPVRIDSGSVDELRNMSYVFIAIDSGPAKKVLIDSLFAWRIPFIDCGMGVRQVENSLSGQLRVTTATDGHSTHVANRISFGNENDDEYDWNIQTADLNMMNAALAVIKWKKLVGYYLDTKHEYNSAYTLAWNQLVSGDIAE